MRPDENSKEKLLNAITSEMQTNHDKTYDISNQVLEIEKIVEMDFKSERYI